MAGLHAAIERAYAAFKREPRPKRIEASPLKQADALIQVLTTVKLRSLADEQIGPYSGSAILTIGTGQDYKYYLPRILELAVSDPVWMGAEPAVIADRVKQAGWTTWPEDQRAAVLAFFEAAFATAVDTDPDWLLSAEQWLCGLAVLGRPAGPFLACWRRSASLNAALQLAMFVSTMSEDQAAAEAEGDANELPPFWDYAEPDAAGQVFAWLKEEATREQLRAALGAATGDDVRLIKQALAQLR